MSYSPLHLIKLWSLVWNTGVGFVCFCGGFVPRPVFFFFRSWRRMVLYLENTELIMRTPYLKAAVSEACPKKTWPLAWGMRTWTLESDRPEGLNPLSNHFPICKVLSKWLFKSQFPQTHNENDPTTQGSCGTAYANHLTQQVSVNRSYFTL